MSFALLKLSVAVYLEAFWQSPRAFATGAMWRLLGKRMRSRHQFAALLGRSTRAYDLWRLRRAANSASPAPPPWPRLVAVVRQRSCGKALQQSLASLAAEGIVAYVLQSDAPGDIARTLGMIDWALEPWILAMEEGDMLAPSAGSAYHAAAEKTNARVIYADDDLIGKGGRLHTPHLKPRWNPELFEHHDYVTGSCIFQANRADVLVAAAAPTWPASLVARLLAEDGEADHLPEVLHHRRVRPEPSKAVSGMRIMHQPLPSLSVVIPTRNGFQLLRTCIEGLRTTTYPDLEIIVANNGSDEKETLDYLRFLAREGVVVLQQPGPFNYSRINNNAVGAARGELICLMNNDIKVLTPDWLAQMASQAVRPQVGAVGAQLLYPDGRIQHAGVVLGIGQAAGHGHKLLYPEEEGYFRRHALPQFVSAVTAACLVIRKDRFQAVGGFDVENFPVAFNDVDLCLKLKQRGWQSFYEPRAVLIHHESLSRGYDSDRFGAARFAAELEALRRIWRTHELVDPFHHPALSRVTEQFALDLYPHAATG
jgi:GT2 family glycosyltransferase